MEYIVVGEHRLGKMHRQVVILTLIPCKELPRHVYMIFDLRFPSKKAALHENKRSRITIILLHTSVDVQQGQKHSIYETLFQAFKASIGGRLAMASPLPNKRFH